MPDQPDVPRIMGEIADLQARLIKAYESGDAATTDRLMSERPGAWWSGFVRDDTLLAPTAGQ